MNPDAYMPYYGATFEAALKGYSAQVKWAYLAACWHYWHHTHCEGLPADDEYLRSVCDCSLDQWARVRGVIFSGLPFFHIDASGKYQQKGCREIYIECRKAYDSVLERSRLGVEARKAALEQPKVEPEVKPGVIPKVEPDDNLRLNPGYNQSESESESVQKSTVPDGTEKKRGGASFVKPSREEANLQAAKIGLPPPELDAWFAYYESNGWRVGRNPMKCWRAAMQTWLCNFRKGTYEHRNQNNSRHPAASSRDAGTCKPVSSIAEAAVRKQTAEMERLLAQAKNRAQPVT